METEALIEGEEFDRKRGAPSEWSGDTIFRYCTFQDLEADPPSVDGAILCSALARVDHYQVLFNGTLVVNTTFTDCVFRGASFRGTRFIGCTFERCRFIHDNQCSACTFDDCLIVECRFRDCYFEPVTRAGQEPLFSKTRFYGCRETGTAGVERLW